MQSDVYFFETFAEEEELLKEYWPESLSAEFTHDSIQDAKLIEPPARFISIRTHSIVPEPWLRGGKVLGIVSRSTGYDHLTKYQNYVPCGYLPEYCTSAVTEQSVLLYMSLAKRLPEQIKHFHTFDRDNLTGVEIEGKNALVVGVGRIGYEIYHRLAKGMAMNVSGIDIKEKHSDVNYVDKESGLSNADVIFCCMNLTKQNANYFDHETFKKTKPGVYFINTARGEFSPAADLLRLVDEGHLGGVALDVFENEALLADSMKQERNEPKEKLSNEVSAILELAKRDNVILTPHNSFNTNESTQRKARQTIEQIEHFLKKGEFRWQVPVD